MVKHNQTILRQIAEGLSVFDHFVGLALKGLHNFMKEDTRNNNGLIFTVIKSVVKWVSTTLPSKHSPV